MAKFCGKCGTKLNTKTGLCPKCKKENRMKRPSPFKILIVVFLLFIILGGTIGGLVYYNVVDIPVVSDILETLGIPRREVSKDSDNAISSLTSGNIEKVNAVIFKEYDAITCSDYAELFETEKKEISSEGGVLARLFSMAEIKMLDYDSETITYEIAAPDMTTFFSQYSNQTDIIVDEKAMGELLIAYAEEAERKSVEVSVSYLYVGDEFIGNYQSYEFINAISGGLVDAYNTLYSELIDAYRNEVRKE